SVAYADQPTRAEGQLLAPDPEGQAGEGPRDGDEIGERLLQLQVAHVDRPGSGLAPVLPVAPELGERSEARAEVGVGIGEQPGRVGRERGAAGQAEEGWIIALDPLPDLAAHREVGRLALVEGDELQALDERRLLLVAQEAVVLPPPDDVELGADRAGLLGRRETGEGRQEQHGRPLHASLKPWRL